MQSQEPPLVGAPAVAAAAPMDPPTPAVSLHVRAPAASAPGQEIDYRILIENQSGGAAHHVMVRVPLPANAAFVRVRRSLRRMTAKWSGNWGRCKRARPRNSC